MAEGAHHPNWFGHCETVAQVKAEYRRLCFMYHPDHGGDSEIMQHINQSYRAALRSRNDAEGQPAVVPTVQFRRRSAPGTQPSSPPVELSRDAVRRLWNASPWQQVASNQYRRIVGTYVVTLVQWTAHHETMWAVQSGGEFSKYAFLTRQEAEEEGFNLLVRQLQVQDS